jgi:hypothetical protein
MNAPCERAVLPIDGLAAEATVARTKIPIIKKEYADGFIHFTSPLTNS